MLNIIIIIINWVPWNVSYKKHILLVTNVLQFLKTMHKQSKNWSGVQYPLNTTRVLEFVLIVHSL